MTYDLAILRNLLARVKSATGPDRELDWLFANIIGDIPKHSIREIGWDYEWYRRPKDFCLWKAKDSEGRSVDMWQPKPITRNIDAAVALIERVLPGTEYEISTLHSVAHVSLPLNSDDCRSADRKDGNVCLALIEAMLMALITIEEGNAS